jgi:hypothetical protein
VVVKVVKGLRLRFVCGVAGRVDADMSCKGRSLSCRHSICHCTAIGESSRAHLGRSARTSLNRLELLHAQRKATPCT